MSHLAPISPRKLIKFLETNGFVCIRIKGSHHFFLHSDGRTTSVPLHGNRDIGIGLLRPILRDIGLSAQEFQKNHSIMKKVGIILKK
jgi:predicted RNA binding protein YcfA (HicA-like mRNA interferase family)